MARNDSPDHELERRLREHFSEEARELRAPDDLWDRLEGRLGKQREPRFAFWRRAMALTAMRDWVPAAAAAAVVVVAVTIGVWTFAGNLGGGGDGGIPPIAAPAATTAPATPAATAAPTAAPTTAEAAAAATPAPTPAAAAPAPTAAPRPTATATPTAASGLTATPRPTPAPTEAPTRTATPAPTAAPTEAPAPTAAPATATPAPAVVAAPTAEPKAETPADDAADGPSLADAADDDGMAEEEPAADDALPDAEPAMPAEPAEADAADDAMPDAEESDSTAERSADESPSRQRAPLSAGEVNDNERWDEYVYYRNQYSGLPVHDVDVTERYVITVTDSAGRPVHNAQVSVSTGETSLFEGRTYANGQTLFFPRATEASEGAESFTLHVAKDGVSEQREFAREGALEWDVVLDLEQPAVGSGVPLDILFLLDSTGSMEDEIDQIKDTLLSIASRISDLPSQPDLRLGMVAYRDRGDEFVTRLYDFEPDAARFLDTIRGVVAYGGGDEPESLNEALHVAVHDPDWRLENAVRLMFLIADAPPHLDYEQDYSYADEMIEAHRRGIKIFSIASSGLDEQGEYVFRQIAQHTMGRFIFIVYGGGGTTPHSVGEYTVERLDDLVVSLVEEELAHLAP